MTYITHYSFGRMTIDGEEYTNDVLILADKTYDNWYREKGHLLQPQDIDELLAYQQHCSSLDKVHIVNAAITINN